MKNKKRHLHRIKKLPRIEKIQSLPPNPNDEYEWIDLQQLMMTFKISEETVKKRRAAKRIRFTWWEGKLYYDKKDILKRMKDNCSDVEP